MKLEERRGQEGCDVGGRGVFGGVRGEGGAAPLVSLLDRAPACSASAGQSVFLGRGGACRPGLLMGRINHTIRGAAAG